LEKAGNLVNLLADSLSPYISQKNTAQLRNPLLFVSSAPVNPTKLHGHALHHGFSPDKQGSSMA
jgi:hypothetical protein